MPSIEVVLGLLLIILFYSLLATVIMEIISSFLVLRGRHLLKVLRMLLAGDAVLQKNDNDQSEEVYTAFKSNPVYQQLAGRLYGKQSPPSYITSSNFSSILGHVVNSYGEAGDSLKEKIERVPDSYLRETLLQLYSEAGEQKEAFLKKVEAWYDDVLDRAAGWFKRTITVWLMVIGMLVAVGFNVDLISVYESLVKSSQADLETLANIAGAVAEKDIYVEPGPDSLGRRAVMPQGQVNEEVLELVESNLESLKDPLGIGWEHVRATSDPIYWLRKLAGWALLALCISKGAQFWYDLLKKAVSFAGVGKVSQPSSDASYAENKKT